MQKKIVTLILAMSCLSGCGWMDSQLSKGPNGEDSKLEQEVKAVAPVAGPYGTLAIALATAVAGVYGAFRAHRADVQTDPAKPTV